MTACVRSQTAMEILRSKKMKKRKNGRDGREGERKRE
jgi:hypothetical protein